MDWE